MPGRAFIGTSGWNYKHWRGLIYGEGFAQRRWLELIACEFDTVEVNTSFYRIPERKSVAAWVEGTPEHFLFALKLWRGITHYRKLRNAAEFTWRFLEVAEVVPVHRRAPLLIQLPPNQTCDLEKLHDYIVELQSMTATEWRIAVEFRNSSWLEQNVFVALERLGVTVCLHDMRDRGAAAIPNAAPFVYLRRHGSDEGRYSGSYSPERLEADAEDIRRWTAEGRDVYVYYNNDIGGHAFHNARDLKRLICARR